MVVVKDRKVEETTQKVFKCFANDDAMMVGVTLIPFSLLVTLLTTTVTSKLLELYDIKERFQGLLCFDVGGL